MAKGNIKEHTNALRPLTSGRGFSMGEKGSKLRIILKFHRMNDSFNNAGMEKPGMVSTMKD